jgi:hypothetical protein
MSTVEDTCKCPGCGKVDRVRTGGLLELTSGWRYHCYRCDWSYGHPQAISRQAAREALHDAQAEAVTE